MNRDEANSFATDVAAECPPGMFNPWKYDNADDARGHSYMMRRRLLAAHLEAGGDEIRFILVGEAPGFRGCRMTGVAFTSEALVLAGAIPRVSEAWTRCKLGERMSIPPRPWTEPSASIMWKCLHAIGEAESTLLWNACPWHPCKSGQYLTNRMPTGSEVLAGSQYLRRLIAAHRDAEVVAVGNVAGRQLTSLGIGHHQVRHPAYGGANEFAKGMRARGARYALPEAAK